MYQCFEVIDFPRCSVYIGHDIFLSVAQLAGGAFDEWVGLVHADGLPVYFGGTLQPDPVGGPAPQVGFPHVLHGLHTGLTVVPPLLVAVPPPVGITKVEPRGFNQGLPYGQRDHRRVAVGPQTQPKARKLPDVPQFVVRDRCKAPQTAPDRVYAHQIHVAGFAAQRAIAANGGILACFDGFCGHGAGIQDPALQHDPGLPVGRRGGQAGDHHGDFTVVEEAGTPVKEVGVFDHIILRLFASSLL